MMRYILVGILLVMTAAIGFVTFQWYQARYGGEPYGAPFTLVDQNGAEITEAAFRDHPTVLFFGFTNCPEICPTTLFEIDGWLKQIGDEGKDINAYFISIDPERDTPEVLKNYVSGVSQRIVGITGEPAKVTDMSKAYGIYSKRVELDRRRLHDGPYRVGAAAQSAWRIRGHDRLWRERRHRDRQAQAPGDRKLIATISGTKQA